MFPAFLGMNVDEIHLEMASREFAEIELIGQIAKSKDVVVGIIDADDGGASIPRQLARVWRNF